jgi:hypothetical protein
MASIIWLAIGIAIASALLGSLVFGFLTSNTSPVIVLEEKCTKIAKEGFQIHSSYPDLQLDQLPTADMNRLMYLDEMWINECVSGLSAESIFNIVQKVERDFYSGE